LSIYNIQLSTTSIHLQYQLSAYLSVYTRVSSRQSNFFFGSNRNKPKLNLFRLFFGLFRETKKLFFGLFRCFGPISKQPKQTEFSRNKPKQTEKIPKNVFFQEVLGTMIFFLGLKNRNIPKLNLFRLFFGLLFHETKKKIFPVCFDVSDQYRNNGNKQKL
jgi:hypothetical protein